ncbi:Glycosyltransferase involved in cell wall bisynthesis [Chryseobacterium rhizoplanae]|uniref:Glycosyltransferase involved in cell wall bisynthesis n=1 Tax=Chryseobacterium rhizoplanae TaxID=1609531 RepID=A0A521DM45_9FLAO|nr:glycosyltransferase family 2 protein [Chryseobacterium rhizoplanae]SMO72777.1 Glycosyltransferase involved in cell wall bisynthesis [Chryseobacterium rhizoplanae]
MKISVIIPVCNAEVLITNAVESALQFGEVYEVILIEDGSYDQSLSVCQDLVHKHERVKLFQHSDLQNHGVSASRNLGIEKSKGDYLAFLNAHDHYLPNRFDAEKEMFENSRVEGIYGALGVHYHSKKAKDKYFHLYRNYLTTVCEKCPPEVVFAGQLTLGNLFGKLHIDTLTLRKESFMKKMKDFFKPIPFYTDIDFLLRTSFYLNLYSGIINNPIAMRGIYVPDRISLIIPDKVNPATKKVILWKELHEWAKMEDSIPEEIKIHIRRMYQSFSIGDASFLRKWKMIFKYIITDYTIIRADIYNNNFRDSLFLFN